MQSINRILISRMKYIGDVVLTTPIIHAVREKYPAAHIAYLGDKKAVSLLENNPYLDEIIAYDFKRPDILEQSRIILALRKRKFDVFVDLYSNPRTAMLAWASGAWMRIGKDVRGRGKVYTHRISGYTPFTSAVECHYMYVKPLDVEAKYKKTEIFITEEEKREARIFLTHQGVDLTKPIVTLHPGATWVNKTWMKERFAELIDLMRAKLNVEILISPGPRDQNLLNYLTNNTMGKVFSLPILPLRQLAAMLSLSRVFVTNGTGPMHIGVAVGAKTIGIFGPDPVEAWFPYSAEDGHKAIFKKIECLPCHLSQCPREGDGFIECMKLITVKDIFDEVKMRV